MVCTKCIKFTWEISACWGWGSWEIIIRKCKFWWFCWLKAMMLTEDLTYWHHKFNLKISNTVICNQNQCGEVQYKKWWSITFLTIKFHKIKNVTKPIIHLMRYIIQLLRWLLGRLLLLLILLKCWIDLRLQATRRTYPMVKGLYETITHFCLSSEQLEWLTCCKAAAAAAAACCCKAAVCWDSW